LLAIILFFLLFSFSFQIAIIRNGTIVIGHDGTIVAVGPDEALQATFATSTFENDVNATGKCVLPGSDHLFLSSRSLRHFN
jgi:imidazolonepropionase-like amidohydrolase